MSSPRSKLDKNDHQHDDDQTSNAGTNAGRDLFRVITSGAFGVVIVGVVVVVVVMVDVAIAAAVVVVVMVMGVMKKEVGSAMRLRLFHTCTSIPDCTYDFNNTMDVVPLMSR
jgi:hypothetical protein